MLREKVPGGHNLSAIAEACAVLTMYAVDARYPGAQIDGEEVLPAIQFADRVIETIKAIFAENRDGENTV